MHYECTSNLFRIFFTTNQPECFEHVQNIRDGLPNQPECSTNVTNAFRISPNALRIMIRTTFELIWAQCDWGIKLEQNLHVNFGEDSVCIVRSCIGSAGFENLISKNHPVKDNRTSIKFTPSFQGCRNPGGMGGYIHYLNCRGDAGGRVSPSRVSVPPIEI